MDQRHHLDVPVNVPCRRPGARRSHAALPAGFRAEHGQATVEFALVVPLLALLVTAIVQLGIGFNRYVTLTDAVRVAARAAAIAGGSQAAATSAAAAAAPGIPLTVQVAQNGPDVTVTALTPYSIDIFGMPVKSGTLSSSTTERIED